MCGEQHYLRSEGAALTTYMHGGRVINNTLFDLCADPLEQRNLINDDPGEWAYSTLRTWAWLVNAERQAWPRAAVHARDEISRQSGERCCEYEASAPRRRARQLKRLHRSSRLRRLRAAANIA